MDEAEEQQVNLHNPRFAWQRLDSKLRSAIVRLRKFSVRAERIQHGKICYKKLKQRRADREEM